MTALPLLRHKPPRSDIEGSLQRSIVQHIRLIGSKDVRFTHIASGEYRSKRTAGRLKALGVNKGWPDLIFILADGSTAMMELKKPGGRQTPEQRELQAFCERVGVEYAVVSSIDTALSILRAWKVLPPERN